MKPDYDAYTVAALLLPALTVVPIVTALKDGLAQTPQMGWVRFWSSQTFIGPTLTTVEYLVFLLLQHLGASDLGYGRLDRRLRLQGPWLRIRPH